MLLFAFLSYVIPVFGAWLADARLGRFRTIVIGVLICFVAHIIMVFGALPGVLQAGRGLGPFIVSLLILAVGAGKLLIESVARSVTDVRQVSSNRTLHPSFWTSMSTRSPSPEF